MKSVSSSARCWSTSECRPHPSHRRGFYRAMLHSADNAVERCPSVRPSVTRRMLSKQLNISNFFTVGQPHDFSFSIGLTNDIVTSQRRRRMQGYKNCDVRPISRFISETIQDTAIVTTECEQETVPNYRMVPFGLAVWLNGNALASINVVALYVRPVSTRMGDRLWGYKRSLYVTRSTQLPRLELIAPTSWAQGAQPPIFGPRDSCMWRSYDYVDDCPNVIRVCYLLTCFFIYF